MAQVSKVAGDKRLRRIALEVPELDRLQLPKAGDAAVGIYFPHANRPKHPPPMECRDGVWATTTQRLRRRDERTQSVTTIRSTAASMLTLSCTATESAAHGPRQPRWRVKLLSRMRGLGIAPGPTTDWQLLVADLPGLPAVARIVEELAPDNEAIAIVEVAEEADLEYLPHRTNVTVIATVGTGNGDGESVLAQLVAAQPLPSGRGYCWFAGEAGQSRAVRKYLRGQHHWDAAQFDILGYWRRDSEAWDKRYASRDFDMDIAEWLGLDLEFHTAITRAAHNPILELAMTSVHLIRPVTNRIFVDRLDRRSVTEQHEQMYEAIATGDPVKSRAAFTGHIGYLDSVRSEVLRDLNADDVRISDIPDQ